MKVITTITGVCPELRAELERIPQRDRAEALRSLATLGLFARRLMAAGALAPPSPTAAPAASPADQETAAGRKRLASKALASLMEDE